MHGKQYSCSIINASRKMDNIKQAALSKSRSYIACLSEANKMLFDNIRTIFARTWIYCAVLAVVSAIYLSLYLHAMLYGYNPALKIGLGVFSLFMLCAGAAYFARIMFLVNGRPMKWNMVRSSKLTLCYVCFNAIIGLIFTAITYATVINKQPTDIMQLTPMFTAFGVASLVIMLLMLPYTYVVMQYMIEPECKLRKIIFKSYVTGVRHWGLIFTALLLAGLCVLICSMLVSVPIIIVMTANTLSVYGVNTLGDPTGLPSYFVIIQSVVFVLTFFIWSYINIFTIFVCYFLYGSIETRETEKRNAKKELKV